MARGGGCGLERASLARPIGRIPAHPPGLPILPPKVIHAYLTPGPRDLKTKGWIDAGITPTAASANGSAGLGALFE